MSPQCHGAIPIRFSFRTELEIDKVLLVLCKRIAEAGARVVEQMHKLSSLTDNLVSRTKRLIEGQSFDNALQNKYVPDLLSC